MATDRTNLTINLSSDIDLDNIVVSGEALLAYIEEALGEDVDYKLTGKNKRWFDLDEDGNLTFREGFDPDLLSAGKAKVSFQVKDTVDGDSNKEIFDFEFKVEKNPSLLQLQEQVIQNSGGSLGAVTVPDANGEILSVTVVGSDDLEAIEQTIDGVTTWVIQTKSGITDLGSEDIEITLNIITDAGEFYADAIQIQVNDAPVASDDSGLSTNEDTALTISIDTLISNDDDIDAEDAITAASLVDYSQPTNGSLSEGAEGELIYTPNPDYNGPDSFTYTIEDGRGGSDTATVSLTVVAVNDAPVANADSDTVAANSSVIINLAANDTDNDNALDLGSIQIVDSPANGTVEINGNGEITYSSTSAAGGTDSFTYTIADVSGAVSLPATVTITVEAPLGIDGSGQDGYISGALVWADSNPDGVFNEATEASGITNTQGDFSLTGNVSGILHLTGGVDIATLLPFEGLMRAPEGYSVISPLTTLIVAVMEEQGIDDPAIAEAQVKLALDLPDVDFSTFDPIAVLSESTDDDDLEAAEQVFGTASQLLNTVKISGSAVAGASDGGATAESAEQSAYSSLASLVVAVPPPPAEGEPSPEPVNLLSSETITQVVQDTAEDVAQQIAEEEGVDPEDVVIEVESELVADLVTASNTQVEETLSESGGGDVLLGVSEVSQVAQGETAEAVSDGDVSTEDLESYTGEGLDEQVEEAVTGDVDGTTTDPDPESLDDFIIGTAGDDVLDGGPDNGLGNDLISGVGGADTLTGGEGDDTVSGGSGNDIIIAGPGNNTYDGGADFDILDYSAATAGITVDLDAGVASINGFGGSDTVTNMEKIAGSAFADDLTGSDTGAIERFTGNAGSDRIDGGAGNNDGVDHRASTTGSGITADLNLIVDDQDPNVGWGTITDEFGSIDYVKNIERVYGTNDDDEIVGDANNNTFIGYGGNDYIDGGDGYDRLFNNGTETQGMSIDLRIDISEGATNVIDDGYGAAGTILNIEEIFGSNLINAGDVIFGDDNDNGLFGQAGDDILAGFGGNDALVGGEGNDELRAGEGNDYLEGNGGADNFVVSNGSAYIGDFEVGTDTIDLRETQGSATSFQEVFDAARLEQYDESEAQDGSILVNHTVIDLPSVSITLRNITPDQLSESDFVNYLVADAPVTDAGATEFDDTIDSGNPLEGGTSDDNFGGLDGNDELYGYQGNDILSGDAGDDYIDGGYGNDQLIGGEGNDSLIGWYGDDRLEGSGGDDYFAPGSGSDEVIGDGDDNVDYFDYGGQYSDGSFKLVVNLSEQDIEFGDLVSGLPFLFADQAQDPDGFYDTLLGISSIGGTADSDIIVGGAEGNNFSGNDGDDILVGFGGDDGLNGGEGNDELRAGEGNDYLEGNGGADNFVVSNGSAYIGDFEVGTDTIDLRETQGSATSFVEVFDAARLEQYDESEAQDGSILVNHTVIDLPSVSITLRNITPDQLSESDFVNYLVADAPVTDAGATEFDDTIDSGNPLEGGTGDDNFGGLDGNDELYGYQGNDILRGDAGDDYIDGGYGNDQLIGGEGNDNISAGAGNDDIDGGAGGEDNANYDSWQFISQRGVTINLGSGQWWDDTQAGEAHDPDGGIDQLTGIESVSGSQFDDAVHVGTGADTGMEIPEWFDSFHFSFSGQSGNDYLESVGDVYVNFTPGESQFYQDEFGNDDPNAGDRFYGNGTGNLNMAEWQFSDQDSGVQIYFGFNGEEGQAYGPNSRVFFNGINDANGGKNDDELNGNESNNILSGEGGNDNLRDGPGADALRGGEGADAFFIQGDSGVDGWDSIDDFEQGIDVINLTEAPVFVTAAQLQAQLDQQAQGDIDNGTDGGTYLQLGSNSNLWISHDDSVSQLTLADFVLSASDPDQTLTGTEFDDQFVPYAEDANFKTGTGVDTVNAGAGNDNIEGNAGDDLLYGEEGSDNISAGQGNDIIDGGAGGEDNANYDSWQFLSQNGVSINLGAGMWDGLATGEARDPDGGIDSLTGIESISGSQYGDALRIGFAADTGMEIPDFTNDYFFSFYGHFGNDYLESVGDVYVNFAPGESEFYQDEFGNDDPNAGDRFYGNGTGNLNMAEWQFSDQDSGVQIYFGFNGEEGQAYGPNSRVFFNGVTDANGGKNNDELWGNEENNYLDGVGGNDILVGAGGNNTLRAGEGFDTAAYTTAPGGITVTGSMQDFDGDGGSHVVYDISNGYGGTDTVVNVERIEGTAFDDEMTGADTDANQRFIGGEGSDRIDGGTGSNDGIDHRYFDNGVGAAGNNGNGITVDLNPIVDAQDPNVGWGTVVDEFGFTDYVKNIERVYATANNDSLTGDAADNIFIAGEGEDFVDGGDGFDWWWSNGTEEQSVIVDLSTNTVTNDGNGFTETILNIEGVFGAGLNDTLIGNADGNNLIAFDGDDILEGLGGDDYLDGGNGADLFIFDANSGNDTIGGFNHSEDSLQLFDFLEITSATLTAADEDGLVNDTLLSIDNGSDFVTVTLLDVELTANDIILI